METTSVPDPLEPDVSIFRPDRPGIRKVLGDLEAEVMEQVWAQPAGRGATVRDIYEPLSARRHIAYTTVMNTMARLARKNLLRVEKHDQAYVYYPNFSEAEFVSRFIGRIIESLLVSFAGPTLEQLSRVEDPDAAARARELLGEIARRRSVEEPE